MQKEIWFKLLFSIRDDCSRLVLGGPHHHDEEPNGAAVFSDPMQHGIVPGEFARDGVPHSHGAVELGPLGLLGRKVVHVPAMRQRRLASLPNFQEYSS